MDFFRKPLFWRFLIWSLQILCLLPKNYPGPAAVLLPWTSACPRPPVMRLLCPRLLPPPPHSPRPHRWSLQTAAAALSHSSSLGWVQMFGQWSIIIKTSVQSLLNTLSEIWGNKDKVVFDKYCTKKLKIVHFYCTFTAYFPDCFWQSS